MNENNPLVCVIDDESSIRESLISPLRSAGLKVQAFSSVLRSYASNGLERMSVRILELTDFSFHQSELASRLNPEAHSAFYWLTMKRIVLIVGGWSAL